MKLLKTIFATLFCAAIVTSAKAIIDVEVLKNENKNVRQLLNEAKDERKEIRQDIKNVLDKL